MAQRLEGNYFTRGGVAGTRSVRLGLGREGVPYQVIDTLMNSLSRSGGTMSTRGEVSNLKQAARDIMRYGADPGAVGQFMGLRQMGGMGAQYDRTYMRVGERLFGRGQVTRFLQSISGAIEDGMSLGLVKGSQEMKSVSVESAKMLYGLVEKGGLTAIGAQKLEQQTRSTMRFGSQISSPEQFRRFMLMREEGDTYFDTLKRMQGGQPTMRYVKSLRDLYGDDDESVRNELISNFPQLSPFQIDALVKGKDFKFDKEKGALPRGDLIGLKGTPIPEWKDKYSGRSLYFEKQREILASAELKAARALGEFNKGLVRVLNTMKEFGAFDKSWDFGKGAPLVRKDAVKKYGADVLAGIGDAFSGGAVTRAREMERQKERLRKKKKFTTKKISFGYDDGDDGGDSSTLVLNNEETNTILYQIRDFIDQGNQDRKENIRVHTDSGKDDYLV